jgi:hypothetical protein
VYVPATAAAGSVTTMVGFHVAESSPVPAVSVNAVRETLRLCAAGAVACPGVKVPSPVVAVAAPDQYDTSVVGTVSAAVPPPVLKLVEVTDAVHAAVSRARLSVTCTAPNCPEIEVPGVPLPRLAVPGTVIPRDPPETMNVVVVSPGAAYAGAVTTAVIKTAVTGSAYLSCMNALSSDQGYRIQSFDPHLLPNYSEKPFNLPVRRAPQEYSYIHRR